MNAICAAEPCPVILNSTCVFYRGANLVYTGVLTNDNLQTVLEKIDNKFRNAAIGYIFNNGVIQAVSGGPVQLGGSLIKDTVINSNEFSLTFTGPIISSAFVTQGGTSSQFVKGDGSLDDGGIQRPGAYITNLTGDGVANGPGSVPFTLAEISTLYAGTWGSSTQIPRFTLDSKGRITNVSNVSVTIPPTNLTFTGDVYGSGTSVAPVTLTINNTNPNVYGALTPLKFSVNNRGLITSAAPITNLDLDGIYGYTPVPSTRTLTINGQTYDLSANRSWTIAAGGSVSSVSVIAGTGISASVTNPTTTPNITITNTAPDQTVSLGTTGSGLSVTGTYPSFTLQNTLPDQTVSLSSGTGISVTGTYPSFTITNTGSSVTPAALTKTDDTNVTLTLGGTPNTALLQAVSLTLGWTGTLADSRIASATTWNAKQNAITLTTTGTSGAATFIANTLNIPQYQAAGTYITSVGATGPITSSGGTTPTISTSMATNKLIGRSTAGTGVMEEITVGSGLSLSGGTISATASSSVGFEMNFLLMGA